MLMSQAINLLVFETFTSIFLQPQTSYHIPSNSFLNTNRRNLILFYNTRIIISRIWRSYFITNITAKILLFIETKVDTNRKIICIY